MPKFCAESHSNSGSTGANELRRILEGFKTSEDWSATISVHYLVFPFYAHSGPDGKDPYNSRSEYLVRIRGEVLIHWARSVAHFVNQVI